MFSLRDVVAKLNFKVDDRDLKNVEKTLDGIKSRLNFIAGAQIAEKLYQLGVQFAEIGQQIKIGAESAGLTVQEFQKLSFAAQQNGVSNEDLSRSLVLLSTHLYQARQGSVEAQRAFAYAGFTPDQVRGFRNAQDALLALSDRLKATSDPIQKAALSRELLGRGSIRMAEFLSKGSAAIRQQTEEAVKLGLVLSGPQVEALDSLQKAFVRLFGWIKMFFAIIASDFAPVITYLIDDWLKFVQANRDLVSTNVADWLINVSYSLGFLYGLMKGVIIRSRELAQALDFDKTGISSAAQIATLTAAFVGLRAALVGIAGVEWAAVWPWIALATALKDIANLMQGKETIFGKLFGGGSGIAPGTSEIGPNGLPNPALAGKGGFGQSLPAYALGPAAGVAGGSNVSISAPMTFNVPPGTRPEDVGPYLKQALTEHFDRQYREADRSLQSPIAR